MTTVPTAILLVRGGPNNGRTIDLSDGLTTLGRDETNDVVVGDNGVSRRHAGIRKDRSGYWMEDFGSRNGTFVNGEELEGEGRRLHDMDRIELGGCASVHWFFRELGATVMFTLPPRE